MRRRYMALARAAVIVVAISLTLGTTAISIAQGRGGVGAPPGGGGGGMGGPPMGGAPFPNGGPGSAGPSVNQPESSGQRGPAPESRSGFQLGPPERRWWDDHAYAKSLKLRPEQQAKMDAIFEQNRGTLQARLDSVHQAESQMEELSRAPSPDESALFAQIDRVTQARADLEKATTHMLLQIRKEMDADQVKKLEKASQR
jgi:Spy/CpxP family protein refolding chaperone